MFNARQVRWLSHTRAASLRPPLSCKGICNSRNAAKSRVQLLHTFRVASAGSTASIDLPPTVNDLYQQLRSLEHERDAALQAAQVCAGRSRRLLQRIQSLKRYAQDKLQQSDDVSARNTLKTKALVHEVLERTINRGQSNYALAARLADVIGRLQSQVAALMSMDENGAARPSDVNGTQISEVMEPESAASTEQAVSQPGTGAWRSTTIGRSGSFNASLEVDADVPAASGTVSHAAHHPPQTQITSAAGNVGQTSFRGSGLVAFSHPKSQSTPSPAAPADNIPASAYTPATANSNGVHPPNADPSTNGVPPLDEQVWQVNMDGVGSLMMGSHMGSAISYSTTDIAAAAATGWDAPRAATDNTLGGWQRFSYYDDDEGEAEDEDFEEEGEDDMFLTDSMEEVLTAANLMEAAHQDENVAAAVKYIMRAATDKAGDGVPLSQSHIMDAITDILESSDSTSLPPGLQPIISTVAEAAYQAALESAFNDMDGMDLYGESIWSTQDDVPQDQVTPSNSNATTITVEATAVPSAADTVSAVHSSSNGNVASGTNGHVANGANAATNGHIDPESAASHAASSSLPGDASSLAHDSSVHDSSSAAGVTKVEGGELPLEVLLGDVRQLVDAASSMHYEVPELELDNTLARLRQQLSAGAGAGAGGRTHDAAATTNGSGSSTSSRD